MTTHTITTHGLTITHALGKKEEYIIDEVINREVYKQKGMVYLKDDVWLDAGAHIGCFSMWAANKVKHIYAFEPSQESFDLLCKNITQNNITNVTPIRAAIRHDYEKTTDFYIGVSSMGYRMQETNGREKITVPAQNINDVLKEYDINSMKIDIEAAEYDVLKALDNWDAIRKFWCEWHFSIMKDNDKCKYNEMLEVFKRKFDIHNYRQDTKTYFMDTFNFIKSSSL